MRRAIHPSRGRLTKGTGALAISVGLLTWQAGVQAAPYTWGFNAAGNWSDSTALTGWNAGGAYPSAIDDVANLTFNITAARTVTIDVANALVGTLSMDDTGTGTDSAWTLATSDAVNNKLTFQVSAGNATLNTAGATNIISAPVVLNSTLDIVAANGLTISGAISGNNGINKTGAGTVTLSSANSFTGPIVVNGGTLALSAANSYAGSAAIAINSGTLSIGNVNALTSATSILLGDTSGSSNAAFTYGGSAGLSGKTITVQSGNTGIASIGVTVAQSNNSALILGLANSAGHGVTFTSTSAGAGGGFTGVISDPVGLLPGTAGVVTINATADTFRFGNINSSYTGGTVLNTGLLALGGGTGTYFGSGSLTINGGGFKGTTSSVATANGFSSLILNNSLVTSGGGGTKVVLDAPVNLGATGTDANRIISLASSVTSDYFQLSGVISDGTNGFTTGIVKNGARLLILSGASNYTGSTTINAGTLRIASGDDRLPVTTVLSVNGGAASGGTFDLNGLNQTVAGLSGGNDIVLGIVTNNATGTSTLTVTGSSTFDGIIQDGSITKFVALTKSTGGKLVLTADNTYTGATNVTGGTLAVNGSLAAGSTVTVSNGGTLGGSGTINGAITIQLGGTLAPGNSPGLLTQTNNLALNTGSHFAFELAADTTADRGINYDGVNVTGAGVLTIQSGAIADLIFNAAGSTVDFASAFWDANQTWLVFADANAPTLDSLAIFDTITTSLDSLGNPFNVTGGSLSFSTIGSDVYLNYIAVPEPATVALLSLGVMAMWRRRKSA